MSFDPVAFRSDRLPAEHFDRRFSEENLAFWVPLLLQSAQITPGLAVLDVGCGTGGFARAIASAAPAQVTGLDRSARFIDFARQRPRPPAGTVRWVVGDAVQLVQAGVASVTARRHLRNSRLVLAEVEREVRTEASSRYGFLTGDELERACGGCAPMPLTVTGSTHDRRTSLSG